MVKKKIGGIQMKKYIILLIIALISYTVYAESNLYDTFSITINYKDGELSKEDIFLIQSPEKIQPIKTGDYSIKVYSFNNDVLFESKFSIGLEKNLEPNPDWFDDEGNQIINPNETSLSTIDEISYTLFAPYFFNAEKIKIFKDDELKLEIDVSEYAICNENGICDNQETHELCPDECLCGNDKCDNGESYTTCSQDCPYTPTERENMNFWQRILFFIKSVFS